jgi:hypothetical protein
MACERCAMNLRWIEAALAVRGVMPSETAFNRNLWADMRGSSLRSRSLTTRPTSTK